jgi:hypothetical protein
MSKRRKKAESDQNKFRMLMQSIHADESELPVYEPDDDDDFDDDFEIADRANSSIEQAEIEAEVIDIEAREIVDPAALPSASTSIDTPAKALPAATDPPITSNLPITSDPKVALDSKVSPDPKPTHDSKPTKSPGRPRKLNAKPKNTNNGQRGRPATGKRSNTDWQGRTFYVRKQTDDVLTSALFKLKRSGIALDKSELVDALLEAWAEITLGDISDFQIGEIVENRLKKP